MRTYKGLITELPENGIFVYGANTQGRHGLGSAKTAREKFGAVYGKTGLQGKSFGIVTKNLTKNVHPSVSKVRIVSQIAEMYLLALNNLSNYDLYVAYSGTGKNLNGYTPQEMAEMFTEAGAMIGYIPSNIVFEEGFAKLIKDYNGNS